MTNALSPSEVVELAELIAGHSTDEDGNPMPLDVALQIIEDTDRYELSLTGREYLMHLRFFYAYLNYGELVPSVTLKSRALAFVNEYISAISSNGYAIVNVKQSRWSNVRTALLALSIGLVIGLLLA